jgi:hypothetical protein
MELVLSIATDKYQKVKDKLQKDNLTSRASMIFKEAKGIIEGKDGYYCYISGTEEQCKRILELIAPKNPKTGEVFVYATEVNGKEKDLIIAKIKEEENKALEGFGGIFG